MKNPHLFVGIGMSEMVVSEFDFPASDNKVKIHTMLVDGIDEKWISCVLSD
jgi:hypothetical protein